VSLGCAHNHLKRNALNLVFTHIYCSLLPWQRTYLFAPRWDFRRFPPLWYHFPIRGLCFRSCLKPCVNYLRCFLVYPVLAADETPLSFAHLIFRALSPPRPPHRPALPQIALVRWQLSRTTSLPRVPKSHHWLTSSATKQLLSFVASLWLKVALSEAWTDEEHTASGWVVAEWFYSYFS